MHPENILYIEDVKEVLKLDKSIEVSDLQLLNKKLIEIIFSVLKSDKSNSFKLKQSENILSNESILEVSK